jgi:hypothetical protein
MPNLRLTSAQHYTPQLPCAVAVCLLLAVSSTCARPLGGKDYFPLAEGSTWTYSGTFSYGKDRTAALRAVARVESKIIIHGREYFKYVITPEWVGSPSLPKLSERVRYYRVAREGVFLLPASNVEGPELLELALPVRPGLRWLDGDIEVKAESAGTLKAGDREYADCLKVSYGAAGGSMATQYYLAPGVGIVRASFADSGEPKSVMELTLVNYKL